MVNLFRRKPTQDSIVPLYGAIVAQARHPPFYADLGVPDTMEGRFDMIVLHLALVMRRLRAADPAPRETVQRLFDHFCRDLDDNLREMGISDIAVPKEMQKLGEAFYGRATAYDRALDNGPVDALAAALNRNVYGRADEAERDQPARLAAYVQRCEEALADQDAPAIAAGRVRFPWPGEAVAPLPHEATP
jgi:cytochrome b pre-mRNA-processing protein 3